jgi:hypothetical protein
MYPEGWAVKQNRGVARHSVKRTRGDARAHIDLILTSSGSCSASFPATAAPRGRAVRHGCTAICNQSCILGFLADHTMALFLAAAKVNVENAEDFASPGW